MSGRAAGAPLAVVVVLVTGVARLRHPGHLRADEETLRRIRTAAPLMAALGLGPTLLVDTTRPVDVAAVTRWVRRAAGTT